MFADTFSYRVHIVTDGVFDHMDQPEWRFYDMRNRLQDSTIITLLLGAKIMYSAINGTAL